MAYLKKKLKRSPLSPLRHKSSFLWSLYSEGLSERAIERERPRKSESVRQTAAGEGEAKKTGKRETR